MQTHNVDILLKKNKKNEDLFSPPRERYIGNAGWPEDEEVTMRREDGSRIRIPPFLRHVNHTKIGENTHKKTVEMNQAKQKTQCKKEAEF